MNAVVQVISDGRAAHFRSRESGARGVIIGVGLHSGKVLGAAGNAIDDQARLIRVPASDSVDVVSQITDKFNPQVRIPIGTEWTA